jgi:magnesium chelatase family protein
MLARRLPGILPPLDNDEAVEVTCIYSAAGLLRDGGLVKIRPFRAPHHTISGVGLIGGGRGPRPGEMTLAHRGVLFLDELPEFGRATLDVLRQPMEEGEVRITRENRTVRMPATVAVVAAMNPCVCGRLGQADRPCACTPAMVAHYRQRVSGPLFDRLDLQVAVPPVTRRDLAGGDGGEPTATVAERVSRARALQAARLADAASGDLGGVRGMLTNAMLTPALIRRHAWPDTSGRHILMQAMRMLGLSARAHDAVLRVARTIADLERATDVAGHHVAEAVQYRILDRGSDGNDQRDPYRP